MTADTKSFKWFRLIPDAYTLAHGLVIVYEVEDTHPVKGARLRDYLQLYKQLDDMDWELQVHVVSVTGHTIQIPFQHVMLVHDDQSR